MSHNEIAKKYPKKVDELPDQPSFVILKPVSFHIPGDERSRQAPGHGYPAHDEHAWSLEVYEDIDAWKKQIEQLSESKYKTPFKAFKMLPVKITQKVEIYVP